MPMSPSTYWAIIFIVKYLVWAIIGLALMAFTGVAELFAIYLWFVIPPVIIAGLTFIMIGALLIAMWYKIIQILIEEKNSWRLESLTPPRTPK